MANYSIWIIGASNLTLSGGHELSGITQGDGSHLLGETLQLQGNDWEEVFVADGGTDINYDDNDTDQVLDGAQVIDGVSYADGQVIEAEYQIVLRDPATGLEYTAIGVNIREPGGGSSFGTVEGLAFVGDVGGFPPVGVELEIVSCNEGPGDFGNAALAATDFASPPCFTAGTLIATPSGAVAVERLSRGDAVLTADAGTARVAVRLERPVSVAEMKARPEFRPVRIAAGALGDGVPERDLLVSRQHRMLVSSIIAERMFGQREVLVSAIRLTALQGIEVAAPADVTYVHLVLDRHRVVLAEGAPTESFFPGPVALGSLAPEARDELRLLFPAAVGGEASPPAARLIPEGHRQRRLVARHVQNGKPLYSPR